MDAAVESSATEADPFVVETAPIASLLREFVDGWRTTRPSLRNRRGAAADALEPVGPYGWLAADTGLPEQTIRDIVRKAKRQTFVPLRVADALVASIGEPAMFYNGTLTVRPNPGAR